MEEEEVVEEEEEEEEFAGRQGRNSLWEGKG